MPATSKKQRTLFCIAYGIKKGETPASYSKKAAQIAEKTSLEDLKDYCESPVRES